MNRLSSLHQNFKAVVCIFGLMFLSESHLRISGYFG